MITYAKISPKMVNPKDTAGKAEEVVATMLGLGTVGSVL